jgi:hypothetical protein
MVQVGGRAGPGRLRRAGRWLVADPVEARDIDTWMGRVLASPSQEEPRPRDGSIDDSPTCGRPADLADRPICKQQVDRRGNVDGSVDGDGEDLACCPPGGDRGSRDMVASARGGEGESRTHHEEHENPEPTSAA